MSEHLYYIRRNDEETGPLTLGQLRSMWGNGAIGVKTPYRVEGGETWENLSAMQSIIEGETPPPVPQKTAANEEYVPPGGKSGLGCLGMGVIAILGLFIYAVSTDDAPPAKAAPQIQQQGEQNAKEQKHEGKALNAGNKASGGEDPAKNALTSPVNPDTSKGRVQASLGHLLIEDIKRRLPKPDSFQMEKQTSFMDLGDFNQSIIMFSAENESGHRKRYEARSHVSHDGSSVAVVEIQDKDSGTPIFEDGVEGVEIQLVKSRGATWTSEDGEEFSMVYLDWKNVGETPIREVKATIRAKDKKGEVIETLSVLSPYYVYVAEDGKGIQPGQTYVEPEGKGYILGKNDFLKALGFKGADVRIDRAYGRRGLEK